jgi:hypothetical protein
MSLVDQPRIRDEVMIEALIAVKMAKQDGDPLQITEEAERIHRQYPDCPVSLDELVAIITRLCAWERVPIQIGR